MIFNHNLIEMWLKNSNNERVYLSNNFLYTCSESVFGSLR